MATHRTSSNFKRLFANEIIISDETNSGRLIVRDGDLMIDYTKTSIKDYDGTKTVDWDETGFAQDVSD